MSDGFLPAVKLNEAPCLKSPDWFGVDVAYSSGLDPYRQDDSSGRVVTNIIKQF